MLKGKKKELVLENHLNQKIVISNFLAIFKQNSFPLASLLSF